MKRYGEINHKKNAGVALVEVTIILPFLFLLMFAGIEGGRYIYTHNTLAKLNRDAARFISDGLLSAGDTDAQKIQKTKNFVVFGTQNENLGNELLPGLAVDQVLVTIDSDYIFVETDYPYSSVFGDTINYFSYGSNLDFNNTLHSEIYMRVINE